MKSIIITAMIVLGFVGLALIGSRSAAPTTAVYDMCQASRTSDNVSESTCGELQDYYHAEYLCKQANNSKSNKCWVEKK